MIENILIVGQLPPPVHGSNVMTQLIFDSLINIGCEVSIVQKTFSRNQKEVGQISARKILKIPVIFYQLLGALQRKHPDVCVYFISIGLSSLIVDLLFLLLLRLFKTHVVIYVHGKGFKQYQGNISGYVLNLIFSKLLGALILGDRLSSDLLWTIPKSHMFILPNAIPDKSDVLFTEPKINQKQVRVLYLSNLTPTKGALEFLKMASIVTKKFPETRFILGGPKREEDFYKKLLDFIAHEDLGNCVVLPGGLYGSDKEGVFLESDIFVFPTKRDAFPLVTLEAMKYGIPVISSNEGSIPEIVIDGITGFIVSPEDTEEMARKVIALIKNPKLRKELGAAGRKRYEDNYTITAYERNLKAAINYFSQIRENK
ncbi:MAG: hypothetical protein CVU55_11395 [Deltaproteobacteria bacterium HGW-Deltaproteobacteria-13]|jgi:glycosyltransferase involved in cell wall biosynthesis|nr:MAG: hypothetical protein CVU55_11395 [Deltaproteobacteria bacterium HGW-Deltaproteobacteria-13]